MYENRTSSHKHQLRGNMYAGIKEIQDGNAKNVIHSKFVNLSDKKKNVYF
ncbi:hypothetical protein B4099_3206 [Heyndrickxia coagulans]|uniref:Uncharacterized protein n=1 Tax=Heyndrickxia coagulans TaxID=1398 RepID=A0A150KHI2_HEYCO|nr:hypothetical protein B4099_3206 [Heyndrickxia coagulans]